MSNERIERNINSYIADRRDLLGSWTSALKCSTKFICEILHRSPLRAARWPSCGWAASGVPRTELVSGVQKVIQYNPLGELLREAHHG